MEGERQIEGRNACLELLKSERDIDQIFVQSNAAEGSIKKIIAMAKEKGIVVKEATKEKLNELSHGRRHQGVIALTTPYGYVAVEDILEAAKNKNEPPFLMILDGITDPHNLGAIIRTAEAFGVHGIIIPKRRSATVNATVLKTSAGAAENMPVAKVTNLSATIEYLKKNNLWIYGADMTGTALYRHTLKEPLAIVVGSEGEGISRLVKDKCDFLLSIPMSGKISSLNASVAAGVIAAETARQRSI